MPAGLLFDTVLGIFMEVSRMLRWTVRTLMVAIASVMVVWACGAGAGALATGAWGGAAVPRGGDPQPVVVTSPELVGVPAAGALSPARDASSDAGAQSG